MRWFKHLAHARLDQGIQCLIDEHGPEGYGVFWMILEMVAGELGPKSGLPKYRLTVKNWANFCSISQKKFIKVCETLENNGHIAIELDGKFATITCDKLLKYRDEYTSRKTENP